MCAFKTNHLICGSLVDIVEITSLNMGDLHLLSHGLQLVKFWCSGLKSMRCGLIKLSGPIIHSTVSA